MGLQGYVGSGEDQRRIRRQEKEREEKKKLYEKAKEQSDANVEGAGLRQFGAGTSEVSTLEHLQIIHSRRPRNDVHECSSLLNAMQSDQAFGSLPVPLHTGPDPAVGSPPKAPVTDA